MVRDTRYISAISADAETHWRADVREVSQTKPDTGPELAQPDWVDAG